MRKFRDYILEAQALFNTKDMIFTNAEAPALVLSTTALERIFGKLERIKAWHITDVEGLKGLKKIQGKKASISVMTEIEPTDPYVLGGIETEGEIIIDVEGTELVSSDRDAWSERLEAGRRAIHIKKENFPSLFRHMEFMVKKMYEKYSKESYPKDSRQAGFAFNKLGQTLSQKEKGQFIKEYIDNCEAILKKNKKAQGELRKYGRGYAKTTSGGFDRFTKKGQHYYNESVINQVSIKNVYLIKDPEYGMDEELLYSVSAAWKDFKIKEKAEIVTLINKKRK